MNGYMSISQRDTHHFDIGNGVKRVFAIRGEPGKVFVRDERDGPCRLKDTPIFRSVSAALIWCAEELVINIQ